MRLERLEVRVGVLRPVLRVDEAVKAVAAPVVLVLVGDLDLRRRAEQAPGNEDPVSGTLRDERASVDGEAADLAAAEVQEEVSPLRDREAKAGDPAVGPLPGLEVQVQGVRDAAEPQGPRRGLGPRQDVGAGGSVQTALRQAARSTRLSLGLAVIPGIRPRFAMGRPSISLMSAVKSMGLAPEM